jgi:hypothetical protein
VDLVFFFETGSCYVAQAGLKLEILLPQPLQCWDYRCVPPYPATWINLKHTSSEKHQYEKSAYGVIFNEMTLWKM